MRSKFASALLDLYLHTVCLTRAIHYTQHVARRKPYKTLSPGPRRLFILRHAERVDVTFGNQWIQLSFDPDGYYHRRNLNMPKEVPQRKGGPNDFLKDTPVTEVGLFQARLTGEGMRDQGIRISHVFSSPALRCIQTAHAILQGLGEPGVKIRIENGLFEWLAWCQGVFPTFMSPNDLMKNGFQVDPSYLSQVTLNDLKPKETHLEFYKRMYATKSQDARAEQWQRDVCGSRGDAGDVHATAGRGPAALGPRAHQDGPEDPLSRDVCGTGE